jgi:threonine aldolase
MEDAIFCSSGTQTNQIGIKLHTQPGDEVICDALAHVYLYEGGGIAFNSGASVRLINSQRGMFTAEDVLKNINDDNVHFPSSKLVCIENTVNKGGGACWNMEELKAIKSVCQEHNLAFHLDGARLFNALVAKNEDPKQYGQLFDTISICLSKGLGAPVGSLLLGSKQHIYKARRLRKVMGGGMRQAGILAAAGHYALENNIQRLSEDHLKAKMVADVLQERDWIIRLLPVETNIVIFELAPHVTPVALMSYLETQGFKVSSMGAQLIRFVFHLDQSIEDIERLCEVLLAFKSHQSH